MRTLAKTLFLNALLLGDLSPAWAQGGWVNRQGAYYGQATYARFNAGTYYDLNGYANTEALRFIQDALTLYGEYGITHRTTLILQVPVVKANRYEGTASAVDMGDLKAALKLGVLQDEVPLSLEVAAEVPTARKTFLIDSGRRNPDTDEVIYHNLATGDGEWNIWTTLAVSQGLNRMYGSLYGAFNKRTQGFQNQWKAGGELGYTPTERVWLIGKLAVLGRFSQASGSEPSFLHTEGTTYTQATLTVFCRIGKNWGLIGEVQNAHDWIVPRRNLYSAPALFLSLYVKNP